MKEIEEAIKITLEQSEKITPKDREAQRYWQGYNAALRETLRKIEKIRIR